MVATFDGHIHKQFGWFGGRDNTYNDSTYHIPSFRSGSTNYLKFLLTTLHRTYFNVAVIEIDDATGQQKFDVDIKCLPPHPPLWYEGDTFSFSAGWSAHTCMIPEMFVADADPNAAVSIYGEDAAGNAFLYEWDFGDGNHSSDENPVRIFGDNNDYTITVMIDDQQGRTGTETIQLEIHNAVPTATMDSILGSVGDLILPGQEARFYGSFSDPGYLDNHTARWDFGDGNIEPGTVTEENELPEATGTVMGTHIYALSGTFTVLLHVQDDDGGEDSAAIDITVMSPLEPDLVDQIDSVIQSLPPSCFKGPAKQHKNALSNKLAAVKKSMTVGILEGAINKLTNDIRAKMDGLVDGKPQDDWIIDEDAQVELCQLIDQLIEYLESGAAAMPGHPVVSTENSEAEFQENSPTEFSLSQNKPNPFNPMTRIAFSLPYASHVKLDVFNVMGQKVATLVDGQLGVGEHVYGFDGSGIASGVYIYRIQADNFVETRRMLLLK